MRNILSSAHVHTTFCDGKSTASDMARIAYDQAVEILLSLGYDHVVRLSPNPEKGMWERIELK